MAAADELEAKRRKVEENGAESKDEEREADAAPDSRAKLKEAINFQLRDCTLNVVPMHGGRVLAPLSDGGLQYLIAGARANVGVKKGRYCFEVKVIELMSPSEPAGQPHRAHVPMPRQLLRVGFATQDASLFLGEADSICFDSEGIFTADGKREAKGDRIGRDQVVAVVLNLDQGSPNKNTISLFKDGKRVSQPLPLPERLAGKPLFPVVNFKNITLQVHFGPMPMTKLPFACRGLQDMAKDDALVAPSDVPKDGKYDVVLPVGIPDEGTFDWLDGYLAKNPHYTELSDRAFVKWAEQSGMVRTAGTSWKHSNDKPDVKFNIPMMDDSSVRRVLNSVIATQPRNYVVMEVKSNLLPAERAELLKRFSYPFYKKVAQITVGDPDKAFVAKIQEELLAEKQAEAEKEWNKRKAEKERQKLIKEQQKKLEEARKQAAKAAAMKEEQKEKKEQQADAQMKAEEKADDAAVKKEEANEEVKKEEEKPEVKEEPTEEKGAEEPEEPEELKPVATLTDEEKATRFRKTAVPDLTTWVQGTHFTKFSLPQANEGFDECRYSWYQGPEADNYFKAWVLRQKVVQRIEELSPGEWFKGKMPEWQKVFADWQQRQFDWKDPTKEAARKAALEEAKRKAEEEKQKAEADKQAAETAARGGDKEKAVDGEGGEKVAEDGAAAPAPHAADVAPTPTLAEHDKQKDADLYAVENICDIGDGEPLFAKFSFEDWALMSLRFELYALVRSYAKDTGDPERIGIHESNLAFYYNKYFRKAFSLRYYGMETNQTLMDLVKDTVTLTKDRVLATTLAEDTPFDMFVRLTEDRRRVRQQAIDAGDETVRLKFNTQPEAPPPATASHQNYDRYGAGGRPGGYGATRLPPPPAGQSGGQWYSSGGPKGGGPYGGGFGGRGTGVAGGSQSRSACRLWLAGNCQYGPRCRFAHG